MSKRFPGARILAVVGALSLAACEEILGVDTVPEPALLIFFGDTSQIIAPDSARVGANVPVRFRTFAGGCTRRIAATDVRTVGNVIEIRPANLRRRAEACTADLLYLEHQATVSVRTPGMATIRVIGEQRGGSSGGQNAPAVLTRTLVVY